MSNHHYAGIGSRETPDHILTIMDHIARYLFGEGWTLRSGGANGADSAFGHAVEEEILKAGKEEHYLQHMEIYLPWKGFENNPSPLHPGNLPFSEQEMATAAAYHPAWDKCSPSAQRLHARNVRQVIGTTGVGVQQSRFVVCWTDGGKMTGGTSQALRMAMALNIPIINLGLAQSPAELEAMVLEIDKIQAAAKGATVQ